MAKREMFNKCPLCSTVWQDRKQFLKDKSLDITGYQVDFELLEHGLFYFTHRTKECGSTMVIEAGRFFDLNPRERFKTRKTNKKECPGYCLEKNRLDRCNAKCECAFVRYVIEIIKKCKEEGGDVADLGLGESTDLP